MSHTPLEGSDPARDYALGWRATWRHVRAGKSWSGGERDCAFLNLGDGRFADVSSASGFDSPGDGRALATTDWDGDGALDLWMTQRDGPRVVFYRNQRPATQRWLAVRLEQPGANRSAIGARVEVVLADGARLVREVAAGSGYLSQSSLEQHFGLGAAGEIASVAVRWPGGERETFTGVAPNQRVLLARGAGAARALPARATRVTAVAGPLAGVKKADARRVEPLAPIPMVGLPWSGFDGAPHALGEPRGAKPGAYQLVTLFTSTCASCAHELGELARSKAALDALGVDALALALDDAAALAAARARLDGVRWPHASGRALQPFQDGLQLFFEELLDRPGPLALPTNLLLDGAGRLVLLHRGPVSVAQLGEDVARLRASGAELPRPALPFAGRWIDAPAQRRDLFALATRLASGGQPALAHALLARVEIAPGAAERSSPAERERAFRAFHELGHARAAAGDDVAAVTAFERALAAQPGDALGALALAGALRRLGRLDEAEARADAARAALPGEHPALALELALQHAARGRDPQAEDAFERLAQREQDNALAHLNLGILRLKRGAAADALAPLARAASLRAQDPEARAQHGKALYLAGRFAEAVPEYQASLAARPEHAETVYNLALAAARGGQDALAAEQVARLEPLDRALAERLRKLLASRPR
ncbi:MAG: ASPIC/UnbV domain-containing protein [Planctomycetes bacterium]|nr:ASPIC/UnbV domain-containing protein [Planctomycetota bacterium]